PEFLQACGREIVVVDANRASIALHGYDTKEQMLARVVHTLSPAAMKIVQMTARALFSGARGRSYETNIRRKDGTVRTVAATWSVIPGHEDTYARILLSSVDLTERLRSEAALRQAQKMEAVGQLTGGVAHDFNNLLTVIGGNLDLLDSKETLDTDLVDPIQKAVERGAELTQRLLAFSRKQPLMPQPINLNDLVVGMTGLLRRSLGEEIAIEIASEASLWLALADPGQVEAALLNMALNSRDAMPDGGVLTLSSRNVVVGPDDAPDVPPGDYVMLIVSDTGTGMPEDVASRAFEPFFTTKEVGKGSGLGLSMVYGFAKQSNGDVLIDSATGRGTAMSLYLPRTMDVQTMAKPQKRGSVRFLGEGQAILVLEDDPDVRCYLLKLLSSFGYRGIPAEDVRAAKRILDSGQPIDLLISDIMLPGGVRGPEFAADLVARLPETQVIFISGRPTKAEIPEVAGLAEAAVLTKPFSREELLQKIQLALKVR
ncbi:MAG: ATP-binding protein, partial [Pseudomonadota bacterium]